MRKLQPARRVTVGLGSSVFLLCFGLCFLAAGLLAKESGGEPSSNRFVFVAVGALLAWGGLVSTWRFSRFGSAEAQIDRDVLRPGDAFELRYRRPVRRSTRLGYLGVFLVFREEVRYHDGSEAKTGTMDRLVLQIKEPERTVAAGDAIEFRYRLAIPDRQMGIRNPFMECKDARLERRWVVKVRLHLAHGQDIWDEYPLEVSPLEGGVAPVGTGPALYDLILQSVKLNLRLVRELDEIFPHQACGLVPATGSVLLERVPQAEAEALQRRLAAAGVSVVLQPADGAAA